MLPEPVVAALPRIRGGSGAVRRPVVRVKSVGRLRIDDDLDVWVAGLLHHLPEALGVFGLRAMREDGWRPNSGYNLLQGHGRAVRNLSPNATLDAGVELYGAKWDSPGFITADQFERGAFDSVANTTDGGFKRRAQERVSLRMLHGSSIWRSTLYATQSRWELFLTTPPEGGGEEVLGGFHGVCVEGAWSCVEERAECHDYRCWFRC